MSHWGRWCPPSWAPAEQHTCYWTTTAAPPAHGENNIMDDSCRLGAVSAVMLKDWNRRFLPQLCQTRRPGPKGSSLHYLQCTGWTGAAAASPTEAHTSKQTWEK